LQSFIRCLDTLFPSMNMECMWHGPFSMSSGDGLYSRGPLDMEPFAIAGVFSIVAVVSCTRIQSLKSTTSGGLTGTQLMAFFLQRRIRPLQAHISKLWSYSSSDDSS
jgi:hypothetical protein